MLKLMKPYYSLCEQTLKWGDAVLKIYPILQPSMLSRNFTHLWNPRNLQPHRCES